MASQRRDHRSLGGVQPVSGTRSGIQLSHLFGTSSDAAGEPGGEVGLDGQHLR